MAQPQRDLDDLAYRFLDNKYAFAGIASKFGTQEARQAVIRTAEVLVMCVPDHEKANRYLRIFGQI